MAVAGRLRLGGRGGVTERSREERRLGWMLCAPAVIAMLLVTAYPIGYAIVLSVQHIDLRIVRTDCLHCGVHGGAILRHQAIVQRERVALVLDNDALMRRPERHEPAAKVDRN